MSPYEDDWRSQQNSKGGGRLREGEPIAATATVIESAHSSDGEGLSRGPAARVMFDDDAVENRTPRL